MMGTLINLAENPLIQFVTENYSFVKTESVHNTEPRDLKTLVGERDKYFGVVKKICF